MSEPQFEWGRRVLSTLDLHGDETVIDAGCGTGRLTALLAERVPRGCVVAVDRSENMVRVAAQTLAPQNGQATVALADISSLPFGSVFDVVFSTATFHWVLDHDALFAELYRVLKAGGRLHAQCGGGANLARLHQRVHELMRTPEFEPLFENWHSASNYAEARATEDRLRRAGFDSIHVELEAAPYQFAHAESFATFASTVVLRAFLARIPDEPRRFRFVERITHLAAADSPPFELDYWRLNVRARRP